MSCQRRVLAAVALALCMCGTAVGQVQVTFPLQGYYRPGKYMPVRVRTTAAVPAPVLLRADGAITVSLDSGVGAVERVVPWLAADEVRAARWEVRGVGQGPVDAPLTPVKADQVLVGIVGANAAASTAAAAALFPGSEVVAVHLNEAVPMPGDPVAWAALDVVVFDDVGYPFLAELLEQGVSLVIRSDARPGGDWDWRGGPGGWSVRLDPSGPRGAIDPGAYAPTTAWRPGWPEPPRRRAALLAVAYCIVALGLTLWRRTRAAAFGVVAVSGAAAAGYAWWGARQPMVREATTFVEIVGPRSAQSDRWSYYRPLSHGLVTVDAESGDKPVFASASHVRDADLRLEVSRTGKPLRYAWHARPDTTLAFLSRRCSPARYSAGRNEGGTPASPTLDLVRECYLSAGDAVSQSGDVGTSADADWWERWPWITVVRAGDGSGR